MARSGLVLCCAAALLLMAGSATAVNSCWQGLVKYKTGTDPVWNPAAKTVSGTYAACWFGQGTYVETKNGTSAAMLVRGLTPSTTLGCTPANLDAAAQLIKDNLIADANTNNYNVSSAVIIASCCTFDNCNTADYNAASLLRPSVLVLLLALLSALSLRQAL